MGVEEERWLAGLAKYLDSSRDLLWGRITAQAKADGPLDGVPGFAHSLQNGCAIWPRSRSQLRLDGFEKFNPVIPQEGDVQRIADGGDGRFVAVGDQSTFSNEVTKLLPKEASELIQPSRVCSDGEPVLRLFRGSSESDCQWGAFGAGTKATLLICSMDYRENLLLERFSNQESANTFWSIDFVSADRKQVGSEVLEIDDGFARGTNRIEMERNSKFFGKLRCISDRLNGANFMIGVHQGDEEGFVRADGFAKIGWGEPAVLIDGQDGKIDAEFLIERATGIEGSGMLNGGRDDVKPMLGSPSGQKESLDCVIDRLGSSARENHFIRGGVEKLSRSDSGVFDGALGWTRSPMSSRRVSDLLPQVGKHFLEDLLRNRCAGVVIQIDRA